MRFLVSGASYVRTVRCSMYRTLGAIYGLRTFCAVFGGTVVLYCTYTRNAKEWLCTEYIIESVLYVPGTACGCNSLSQLPNISRACDWWVLVHPRSKSSKNGHWFFRPTYGRTSCLDGTSVDFWTRAVCTAIATEVECLAEKGGFDDVQIVLTSAIHYHLQTHP